MRTEAGPNRLTYLVKQLQEALRVRLDEITQQFGLTPKQYTALTVLNRYPGVSSAALGRLTFVSPQAANEMVATLERKGFLERSIDAGNRRRLEVALTRQGATALARCDVLADQLESEVLRGFDASERQRFKAQLQICLEAASAPAPFQPTSERR